MENYSAILTSDKDEFIKAINADENIKVISSNAFYDLTEQKIMYYAMLDVSKVEVSGEFGYSIQ